MSYLLSIDVEDWFQVENLKGAISKSSWESQELRVEKNLDLILRLLEESSTSATFFVLGWIAERCPELVRRIHALGHEIASHGYGHELIYNLSVDEFRKDIDRSKKLLEDITGESILGYRAPSFSITDQALDTLAALGFAYVPSLFATRVNKRYGQVASWSQDLGPVQKLDSGLTEVSLSCLQLLGQALPWSGGGYFRLLPYQVFKQGVKRIAEKQEVYTLYVHPWEFDPDQPRVAGLPWQLKFRHYVNLDKTRQRFAKLIEDFPFEPIRSVIQTKE